MDKSWICEADRETNLECKEPDPIADGVIVGAILEALVLDGLDG